MYGEEVVFIVGVDVEARRGEGVVHPPVPLEEGDVGTR
jgi:hypothetical protein